MTLVNVTWGMDRMLANIKPIDDRLKNAKFFREATLVYDTEDNVLKVHIEIYKTERPGGIVFDDLEPLDEFPSNLLMTKIIMVAG